MVLDATADFSVARAGAVPDVVPDVGGGGGLEVRYALLPNGCPLGKGRPSEFATKYTPVLDVPERFAASYLLSAMVHRRSIRTLLSVTMYNETPKDLERTLKGICRNVDTFVATLGKHAWRNIQVVIVSDGRRQCNAQTLEYLESIGVFKQQFMDDALEASSEISLHLFETTVVLSDSLTTAHNPVQVVFALKEENGGKLDSHRWFFNAIAVQIRPKYVFLVDVGTKPDPTAIWKLYECMEQDKQVGGCCGEIDTIGTVHINPYIAAQQFEYLISTVLDKSMESVFGFISVLPGAFSAYRYEAIVGTPLTKYFKLVDADLSQLGPFQGNLYLAEDRILCFEVLARKDCNWTLKYVKGATASTDVPDKLTGLIKQRRRWLNGSLFATLGVLSHLGTFLHNSSHHVFRKMVICILFTFYAGSTLLSWFLLANFYLMFVFATAENSDYFAGLGSMFWILTIIQVVIGLGNKPGQMEKVYFVCTVGYGAFFFATLGISIEYLVSGKATNESTIGAVGTIGAYLIASLLHGQIFPVLCSLVQYFFMLPTFMISFPIYSFSNIHDVSWGTKGLEQIQERVRAHNRFEREQAEAKQQQQVALVRQTETRFRIFRSYLVIAWLGSNFAFIAVVQSFAMNTTMYFASTFVVFFIFNAFRFVFSVVYLVMHWIKLARGKNRCPPPTISS